MFATRETVEAALWKALEARRLSASHNNWHIRRVLGYALGLAARYPCDESVLTAAVMLHDLGRSDPILHGAESRSKSVADAGDLLRDSGLLSDDQITEALAAIDEHDQPDHRPSNVEGRILKDADFLAGFGAWGVLRSAIWSAESESSRGNGEPQDSATKASDKHAIEQFFVRLDEKMPARMRGLEFPESRAMAKKLNPLARYFRHELEMVPDLTLMEKRGAYIVLEGISGSGKDTQAQELLLHFNELGFMTHMVQEPTPFYKETRQFWDSYRQEPWWQAFLLMADRFRLIRTEVEPSLNRGETVISVRSYLSTVAHQGRRAGERELFELAHRFVPPIDLVFILDLPAEVARNRCLARAMAENRLIGDHETTEMLDATRWEYLKLRESHAYEDFVVVDADRAPEVIQKEIQLELEKRGYLNLYSATGGNPTG